VLDPDGMIHAVVMTFLALSLSSTPNPPAIGSGKAKYPPRTEKPKPPSQDPPSQDRPAPAPPEQEEEEPRPRRPNRDEDAHSGVPQSHEAPHLAVIRSNMPQVENCFDRARAWSPALRGEVVLEWEISSDGTVERAVVTGNTTGNTELADCILQAVKSWRFRETNGPSPRHVRHPFQFQSS
jgi:TonB family protein